MKSHYLFEFTPLRKKNTYYLFSIFSPNQSGISGQLLFDLKNGYEAIKNVTLNDTGTQAQSTNIISNGKLCDPNVQQHR